MRSRTRGCQSSKRVHPPTRAVIPATRVPAGSQYNASRDALRTPKTRRPDRVATTGSPRVQKGGADRGDCKRGAMVGGRVHGSFHATRVTQTSQGRLARRLRDEVEKLTPETAA